MFSVESVAMFAFSISLPSCPPQSYVWDDLTVSKSSRQKLFELKGSFLKSKSKCHLYGYTLFVFSSSFCSREFTHFIFSHFWSFLVSAVSAGAVHRSERCDCWIFQDRGWGMRSRSCPGQACRSPKERVNDIIGMHVCLHGCVIRKCPSFSFVDRLLFFWPLSHEGPGQYSEVSFNDHCRV